MKSVILTRELAGYGRLLKYTKGDTRLNATHVSLFTALFVLWQRNCFASPFAVNRRELMAFSKIASLATYHKCIRELDASGYICYRPSYHPKLGSQVYWPDGWELIARS